ncbi:MAG: DoxX family protein [Actinobacteria bacterium]|nr:DoxX family protein [Actinomycetota bacterium]
MLRPQPAPSVSTSGKPGLLRLIATVDRTPAFRVATRAATVLRPAERLDRLDAAAHRWLVAHSIALLRISLGAVFLGFGALKLFPGVSPAQNLVEATTHILTFGLVPGPVALFGVAALECTIGLCLISGRALRGAIYLLGIQLVGILSPVVLLAPRLFMGPHNAPTLEGQYVLKDIILVGATLVVAATLRGGMLTSKETSAEAE